MGGKCYSTKYNLTCPTDNKNPYEMKQLDFESASSSKKIIKALEIVNFRKKCKRFHKEIALELNNLAPPVHSIGSNFGVTFQIKADYDKHFQDLKQKALQLKLNVEFEDIENFHDITQLREFLKGKYISYIKYSHQEFYRKLQQILKSTNPRTSIQQDKELFRNSTTFLFFQNQIVSHQSLTRKSKQQKDSSLLQAEFDTFFELCLDKIIFPDEYGQKKSQMLKLLFEESELLLKGNAGLKKFLLKYFYFYLLKHTEGVCSTGKDFLIFKTKEIRKIHLESTLEKFSKINFEKLLKDNEEEGSGTGSAVMLMNEQIEKEKDTDNTKINTQILQALNRSSKHVGKFKSTLLNSYNHNSTANKYDMSAKITGDCLDANHTQNINSLSKQDTSYTLQTIAKGVKLFAVRTNVSNQTSMKTKEQEYYRGQYDKLTLLYCGEGCLFKKNYLYEGTFRMGKKSGIGFLYKKGLTDGLSCYQGELGDNHQDGFGTLVSFSPGRMICQKGIFQHGNFIEGQELTIEENEIKRIFRKYDGEKSNDKYHGYGKYIEKIFKKNKNISNTYELDTDIFYEGDFSLGKYEGKGHYVYSSISRDCNYDYTGDFKESLKHGYGKIIFSESSFIKSYNGFFDRDKKFSYYGIVEFRSGDAYEGFFDKSHHKSTAGIYFHALKTSGITCENFFGNFSNDKKHGIGRFISPLSKKVLVGVYSNGEKNGQFTCTFNKLYQKKDEKDNFLTGIKQQKVYLIFEDDDVVEKSDRPFVI